MNVRGLVCGRDLLMGCLCWGPVEADQVYGLASGHFRNGILLGPLTGYILAELVQGRAAPFDLDLSAFDPDRFGGWAG